MGLESLEPRLLLSADLAGLDDEDAGEQSRNLDDGVLLVDEFVEPADAEEESVDLLTMQTASTSQSELIQDGSFSSGGTYWTLGGDFWAGTHLSNYRTPPGYAAGGVDSAGWPKDNAAGWMRQQVTIPADATSVELSYWYNITTEEPGTSSNDHLTVWTTDPEGASPSLIRTHSNLDDTGGGYVHAGPFDLSSYAGETVLLRFTATTNETYPTVFRIDDVSITATMPQVTAPTLVGPGAAFPPGPMVDGLTPTFTWEAVAGADEYGLYISQQQSDGTYDLVFDSDFDLAMPITETSFTLPGGILEEGEQYRWNMSSFVDGQRVGGFSDRLYFQTEEAPAVTAPTPISPGFSIAPGPTVDTLSPTFTWEAVAGADEYGLYISQQQSDGTYDLVFDSDFDLAMPITDTSFTLPGGILEEGEQYRWNMSSFVDGQRVGGFSDRLYFQTDEAPAVTAPWLLGPGSSVPPGSPISTSPTFTWEAVSGADEYGLYISEHQPDGSYELVFDSDFDLAAPITGTSFQLPDGILGVGEQYRWNMSSFVDGVREGGFSDHRYFAMVDERAPILQFPGEPSSPGPVIPGWPFEPDPWWGQDPGTFFWQPVADAEAYILSLSQRRSDGVYEVIFDSSADLATPITSTPFVVADSLLEPDAHYRWTVSSIVDGTTTASFPEHRYFRTDAELDTADIPDPNLRAVVRDTLQLEPGAPITLGDLQGLWELNAPSAGIQDLTGLEHAENLSQLHLWRNAITDVSPLAELTSLHTLTLIDNEITDISPLEGMTQLSQLRIHDNRLDISPGSTNLAVIEQLEAAGVWVTYRSQKLDADAIPDANLNAALRHHLGLDADEPITTGHMASLPSFTAFAAGIEDLTGLEYAENLSHLNLADNQITDVSPLAALNHPTHLVLIGNQIADPSSLADVSVQELRLADNQIVDASVLADLTNVGTLDVRNNYLDVRPGSADMAVIEQLMTAGVSVNYRPQILPADAIPDANLEAALRDQLGLNADEPITSDHMAGLHSFTAFAAGIEDLTGLEHAVNLASLSLPFNEITDVSPLADLPIWQSLTLSGNRITDPRPLSNLDVHSLRLDDNQIVDASVLADLTDVWTLDVRNNYLDISPGSADMAVLEELMAAGGVTVLYEPQKTLVGPIVASVEDGEVEGSLTRQWLTIHGSNLPEEFHVTFRDETNDVTYPTITDPDRLEFVSTNEIRVFAGVGVAEATWSVVVHDPVVDVQSQPMAFEVRPPEEIDEPVIGNLIATPDSVTRGDAVTLRAGDILSDVPIERVEFYHETSGLILDRMLGTGIPIGTEWILHDIPTDAFLEGEHILSARAFDEEGTAGPLTTTELVVTSPPTLPIAPIESQEITNWWIDDGNNIDASWQRFDIEFTEAGELLVEFRVHLNPVLQQDHLEPLNPISWLDPFEYKIDGMVVADIWKDGIESIWGSRGQPQYELRDDEGRVSPIIFDVEWVDSDADAITVDVHEGPGRASAQDFYPEAEDPQSNFDHFEYQQRVVAHEAGHWFGLLDEYAVAKREDGEPVKPAYWPLYTEPDSMMPFIGDFEKGRSKEEHNFWEHHWFWGWRPADNWTDWVDDGPYAHLIDGTGIMGANLGNPLERNFQQLANWLMDKGELPELVIGQAPTFQPLERAEAYDHSLNHQHPEHDDDPESTAPMVDVGDDVVIDEGTTVLRAGAFEDPDEGVTWEGAVDWGDGSEIELLTIDPETQTFQLMHDFSSTGTYTVRVGVRDSEGTLGEDTFEVTVRNVPPEIAPIDDLTVAVGTAFTVEGAFSDPGDDDWVGTVDFGDSISAQPLNIDPDEQTFQFTHAYEDTGTYTVAVMVDDQDGGVAEQTFEVTVGLSVVVGSDATRFLHFTDATGTQVRVQLTGGRAEVLLTGAELERIDQGRRSLMIGSELAIHEVALSSTKTRDGLIIQGSGGDGRVEVGTITGDSPLGRIVGPNLDLVGDGIVMEDDGTVGLVRIGSLLNGADLILPGDADRGVRIQMDGSEGESDIYVAAGIRLLHAHESLNGSIEAPWIHTLKVNGELHADVTVTDTDHRGTSIQTLNAERIGDVAVTAPGHVQVVRSESWEAGALEAGSRGVLAMRGHFGAETTIGDEKDETGVGGQAVHKSPHRGSGQGNGVGRAGNANAPGGKGQTPASGQGKGEPPARVDILEEALETATHHAPADHPWPPGQGRFKTPVLDDELLGAAPYEDDDQVVRVL